MRHRKPVRQGERMGRRGRAWFGAGLATVALSAGLPGAARAALPDYSTASFTVTTHSYAFGQAPMFMPDGKHVVFGKDFRQGDGMQVYMTGFDGSDLHCLTCGGPGPNEVNNVPAPRPQGDWILFHSWRGHRITIG